MRKEEGERVGRGRVEGSKIKGIEQKHTKAILGFQSATSESV